MQNSTRCDRQQHHGWYYRNISKEIFPEYLDHGDLGTPGTKSNERLLVGGGL